MQLRKFGYVDYRISREDRYLRTIRATITYQDLFFRIARNSRIVQKMTTPETKPAHSTLSLFSPVIPQASIITT